MKVRDIEGTPEEIGKFCDSQNFSIHDYLHGKPKINGWWIISLTILFIILCGLLWTFEINLLLKKLILLTDFVTLGALVVIIQLKFEKWIVTSIVSLLGLIIISLSLNLLTPEEAIKTFKNTMEVKKDKKIL